MEKIAVETEIWPADVKYAEEITEASLAKLGEKFMQRMWELPRGKKVCVSCMEQRKTPPSGMPMVMRILLDVQGWASVMAGNVYRHFKGGLYVVQGVAVHSETAELLVIYTSKDEPQKMWARPLEMFLSPVDKEKYPRAKQKKRFEKVKAVRDE